MPLPQRIVAAVGVPLLSHIRALMVPHLPALDLVAAAPQPPFCLLLLDRLVLLDFLLLSLNFL